MSNNKYNMIGKKFGRLIVLKECNERSGNEKLYKCQCECGNITYVRGSPLRNGHTKSCGCLRKSVIHGKSNDRLYNIYCNMVARCYDKKHISYLWYGYKGIKVYREWLDNRTTFFEWAINNGYKDNLTIDRIDVNGNYEPNNCRWITNKEQQNNRTNNIRLTYNGKTQTISQWADELCINRKTISTRYYRGWSMKECLFGKG